jgi:hypothetical protein
MRNALARAIQNHGAKASLTACRIDKNDLLTVGYKPKFPIYRSMNLLTNTKMSGSMTADAFMVLTTTPRTYIRVHTVRYRNRRLLTIRMMPCLEEIDVGCCVALASCPSNQHLHK